MSEPFHPPEPGKSANWFNKNGKWFFPLAIVILIGLPVGWMLYGKPVKPPPPGPSPVPTPTPLWYECGNGIVEPPPNPSNHMPEQCDPPGSDCGQGYVCDDSCLCEPPHNCGNDVLDPGEQCDGDKLTQCISGQSCDDSCQCVWEVIVPGCGNDQLDPGEQCDGDKLTQCVSGQSCDDSCQCVWEVIVPGCGNNYLDPGEQCDGDKLTQCVSGQSCSDSCQCFWEVQAEICGNGVLDFGEQCDGDNVSLCLTGQSCSDCQCVSYVTQSTEYFPVYDCKRIGGELYEWYGAEVVMGPNGEHLEVTYVDGPHQGPWRPYCPGEEEGDGGDGGGDGGDGGGCVPTATKGCP